MASPEELKRLIKFHLSDLGGQNGHHEFEHMCRAIGARRIASNIVPATGPVSAGGDQGRDFETFRTFLAAGLNGTSGFLALASTNVLAFACTLQRDGLPAKIKADVASICSAGTNVHTVYFFATGSVPVATRHRLQSEVNADYQVHLEILDGEAIATFLAEPDLYWIANQYLHLPLEMAPSPGPEEASLPGWYLEARARWRSQRPEHFSSADFFEVRQAVRHATYEDEARPDLPEWLALLSAIMSSARDADDLQQVRYEYGLAHLRGGNTLVPAETAIHDFFRHAVTERGIGLLADSATLLTYCLGARARGLTGITASKLSEWNRDMQTWVRSLLAEDPPTNRRAALLSVLAHLALSPVPADPEDVDQDSMQSPSEVTRLVREARQNNTAIPIPPPQDLPLIDLAGGFDVLTELADLLTDVRTFPIEQLCDWFDLLSPLLVDEPRYAQVRDAFDSATDRVAGDDAVASRCMSRAVGLARSGLLVRALDEFHEAKVNWFHGDTLHNSLQAMLFISHIYAELRLPSAAKQYAVAVAFVGVSAGDGDLHEFVPRSLFAAADCDYAAGAWASATDLTSVAVMAQNRFMPDPWNQDRYNYLLPAWSHQAMRLRVAEETEPTLAANLRSVLADVGLTELIDHMLGAAAHVPPRTADEWAQSTDSQISGRPFDDVGPERRFHWAALGTRWHVSCPNDRASVLAAERFCAAAQVLLADMSAQDPLLLPGNLHVSIKTHARREIADAETCQELPDNSASRWLVSLTAYDAQADAEQLGLELLAALTNILLTRTLLPTEPFMALVEDAFRRGLTHKLGVGRPYDEIADLRSEERLAALASFNSPMAGAEAPRDWGSADKLPPRLGPGPGYSVEESLADCVARYENIPPIIRFTLPRVLANERTRQLLGDLKNLDGWLDWHLLNAVANIVGNERARAFLASSPPGSDTERAQLGRLIRMPEDADGPVVPLTLFTRDSMQDALNLSALHTVHNWRLESHQSTPDFAGILTLLGQRYGYWSDDVPHESVLGPSVTESAD